jgi:hypothetical protein
MPLPAQAVAITCSNARNEEVDLIDHLVGASSEGLSEVERLPQPIDKWTLVTFHDQPMRGLLHVGCCTAC